MTQTRAIHLALKQLIRGRGRNYAEAAAVLELSEASVKRLFSRGELSLQRLEALCSWLGVEVADLIAMSVQAEPLVTRLTPAQERELLADQGLLLTAFLLLNGWRERDILETFNFSKPELTRHWIHLERLGLIELMPFDRIKLRTARNFSWHPDGPIEAYFAQRVLPEFLTTRFDQPGEQRHFVGGMLSRASVHALHQSMEALARQLNDLVTQDLKLPVAERHGVSLYMALRPWEFSEFTRLRRQPRSKFY